MSPGPLRTARLEAKACLLGLGPWPWVGAGLYLTAAWTQEPSFFRQQQLDLAWPAAANTADALSLLLVCQLFATSHPANGWGRGLASLLLVLLCTLATIGVGLGLDTCFLRTSNPSDLTSLAIRPLAFWPSVSVVGLGVAQCMPTPLRRVLWILFAFGVQTTLLPADERIWERSLHSWLAVVATFAAGSAFLTSNRLPRRRGDLPCA